jgi:hypothetical protein
VILHLDDRRHISVDSHSGKIWLSSHNGCGTINPLTPDEAAEIGLALFREARKMKRA